MIALILAAAVTSGPIPAPKAMLGRWDFGQDGEGAPACVIRLDPDRVIGGFRIVAAKGCARVHPRADDFYAWYVNPDGRLVIADPERKAVVVLLRDDPRAYSTAVGEATAYLATHRR